MSLKKTIEDELARWPEEDGIGVFDRKPDGSLRLRYSRPAVEPFTDFQGRLLCVGHVVVYEG